MTESQPLTSRWVLGALVLCAVAISTAVVYRLAWHAEHDWVQIDARGAPKRPDDTIIPRIFDRRTGELCEYYGAGAKKEYTSQFSRGPWVCFPGPASLGSELVGRQ